MRRDKRYKRCCHRCGGKSREPRHGEIAVFDLPVADRTAVWVTLPAVQGRCQDCLSICTPRPVEMERPPEELDSQ